MGCNAKCNGTSLLRACDVARGQAPTHESMKADPMANAMSTITVTENMGAFTTSLMSPPMIMRAEMKPVTAATNSFPMHRNTVVIPVIAASRSALRSSSWKALLADVQKLVPSMAV